MSKRILIFSAVLFLSLYLGHAQCTHTIALTDTWGDGWNGGTVTVSVNGTPVLTNITLAAGAGPENHTFTASTGDIINVTRTAAGLYSYEMRIRVFSVAGDIIPLIEPVASPGTNGNANCSAPPPGCNTGSAFSSYTPLCNGTQESYAAGTWAGEYNTLTLTAGVAYTFGSSIATDYITITTSTGTILTAGTQPINYTPASSGTYRVYIHTNSSCGTASVSRTPWVQCGTPPPPGCNTGSAFSSYTPLCNGTQESYAAGTWAGEYNTLTLTAGVAYTFGSSIATDYITITTSTGTILTAGTQPINYTPASSGTYRVYIHTNSSCGTASVSRTPWVQCGTPPPPGCNTGISYSSYTPLCNGTQESYAAGTWAGEYNTLTLTAGVAYTFGSSIATDYITVTTSTGIILTAGTQPINFTPSASGTYRVYIHTNSSCGTASVSRTPWVQCGSAPPPGTCIHATPWLTASAPTNTSPMEISACTYAGEYNTITNIVAGHTYQFSSGMGSDWLVLTDASNNVIVSGTTPITWTATFSGTVRLHVSANSSCLTDTWCRSTSITCTSCAGGGGGGGSGYLHPVDGQQSAFVGACMVNLDCGASHDYYDNGGASGHYSNNIGTLWFGKHGIYRTFCPDVPGQCVRAQVVNMNIENNGAFSCYDELIVINGATQNNTPLWHGCGTHLSPVTLAGGWSGGTFTANNSSGCLGFRFYSDASGTRDGWHITLSCVPCVDAQQISNNDCGTSMPICDVTSFTGVSPGPGLDGVCSGCVISENYSSWYYFEITADGVLGITITPNNLLDDYDFALYNGGADCSALGAPIRCSYAEGTGATGMGNGAWDTTEDVLGDGWVSTLNVTAGDAYYLMVNNWSPGGSGFEISFQWGGGAGADCAIVPIDLLSFDGQCSDGKTTLQWATASELNNDYYTILKSGNGITFKTIGWILGTGTSNELNYYSFTDEEENEKPMYYQLKQTDYDGEFSYSKMIQVDCGHVKEFNLTVADNSEFGFIEALFDAVPNVHYIITLTDPQGKIAYQEVVENAEHFVRHTIHTHGLSQGIYILNVQSQANSHHQKVMIR